MAQSFLYHVTIHDFNYNGFHGFNVTAINCAEAIELAKKICDCLNNQLKG